MQTTLTILVVDDETSFATALAALLSRDGHQVDTAENGNAALRQIQARHYGPAGTSYHLSTPIRHFSYPICTTGSRRIRLAS